MHVMYLLLFDKHINPLKLFHFSFYMVNYGYIESTKTKLMFLGSQPFLKGKGVPILKS